MTLHDRVNGIWYGGEKGGLLPALLGAAAWPYALALGAREALYGSGLKKTLSLPVPCLSVGNLVVGGTGKTPAVSWCVDWYRRAGYRAGVVSRGYGGTCRGPAQVDKSGDAAAAARCGDEPALLAARHRDVPVVVGRDRVAAGLAAAAAGAEVVVADDAFQHRRLVRNFDIVVVDAGRWFGNGRLFPGGPLRETREQLKRADAVLLTRVSAAPSAEARRNELRRLAPHALVVEGEIVPAGWRVFGREGNVPAPASPVFAFCGLANPGVFRRSLDDESVKVAGWKAFPDHHPYGEGDLQAIAAAAEGAAAAVTTEKDAVRIQSWKSSLPLFVLTVAMRITRGEEELADRLGALVEKRGR